MLSKIFIFIVAAIYAKLKTNVLNTFHKPIIDRSSVMWAGFGVRILCLSYGRRLGGVFDGSRIEIVDLSVEHWYFISLRLTPMICNRIGTSRIRNACSFGVLESITISFK